MVDLEAGRALCRFSERDPGIEALEGVSESNWRSVYAVYLMSWMIGEKMNVSALENALLVQVACYVQCN